MERERKEQLRFLATDSKIPRASCSNPRAVLTVKSCQVSTCTLLHTKVNGFQSEVDAAVDKMNWRKKLRKAEVVHNFYQEAILSHIYTNKY